MTLRRVQVTDFRCLHRADLELDPNFTLVSGPNASGKTSVLEAIYMLGRGRSFRTRRLDHLIRAGTECMLLFGEACVSNQTVTLGIEGSKDGLRAKLAGEWVTSLAQLAATLPVQIIDPEIHRLIEEGPGRRRRLLDWGVFHVEPNFVSYWQKYQQVLRQRNAALRLGSTATLVSAWDTDLVRYGVLITEARTRYVDSLLPIAQTAVRELLHLELGLHYRPGWSQDLTLSEALARSWRQDLELRATQVGPQRAELVIRVEGLLARDRISRGQQKLLAAVLLLSQMRLLPKESVLRPVLLLDDPAAELDGQRVSALIRAIRAQPLQLIVTTLDDELAGFAEFGVPGRRYRMDEGEVRLH